jgi:hypothetical protein
MVEVDTDATLIDHLKYAISETVAEFQANPVDFLYESDIQSLLFTKLRHEMREVRYESKAKDVDLLYKSEHSINPVKTEYRLNASGLTGKFDVAILSKKHDPAFRIWHQFCRIGIELKLWQSDGTGLSRFEDFERLQSYRQVCHKKDDHFTGIAMIFVHPGAEKWVKDVSGVESDASFPNDGVVFQIVESSIPRWYEIQR